MFFLTGSKEAKEGGVEPRVQTDQWETPQDIPEETSYQSCTRRPQVGYRASVQEKHMLKKIFYHVSHSSLLFITINGLTYVCTFIVRNLYRASPLWGEMRWMTCTFYQPCQLQRRRIKAGQRIMFTSYCGRSRPVISAVRHAEFYVCALLSCCSYFSWKPAVIIILRCFVLAVRRRKKREIGMRWLTVIMCTR